MRIAKSCHITIQQLIGGLVQRISRTPMNYDYDKDYNNVLNCVK